MKAKHIFWTCSFLICLLIVGVGLVPSLLSYKPIGRPILSFFAKQNAPIQELDYDELSIGWLTKTKLTGLKVTLSSKQQISVSLEDCLVDRTLFNLLLHPNLLGTIELHNPHIVCQIQEAVEGARSNNHKKIVKIKSPSEQGQCKPVASEKALSGHIILQNGTIDVKDKNGCNLLSIVTRSLDCEGAFDLQGSLAIKTSVLVYDQFGGQEGHIMTNCLIQPDMSFDGTVDLDIPCFSTKTLEAIQHSFLMEDKKSSLPLSALLGQKISLSFFLQDHVGHAVVQSDTINGQIGLSLHNTTVEVNPGPIVKVALTPEQYATICQKFQIVMAFKPVSPLTLDLSLTSRLSFNWKIQSRPPLSFGLKSNNTLWTNGQSTFYSSILLQNQVEENLLKGELSATLKKRLDSEGSHVLAAWTVPLSSQSDRFFIEKATASIHFTPEGQIQGISGESCQMNATFHDCVLPLSGSLSDMIHALSLHGSIKGTIPRLLYQDQKLIENFDLTAQIEKQAGGHSLSIDMDQHAILGDQVSTKPILRFLPDEGSFHLIYNLDSGDIDCNAYMKSNLAELSSGIHALYDIQEMKFQVKELSKTTLTIKRPLDLLYFSPITFQESCLFIEPFQCRYLDGKLVFQQDPKYQLKLIGLSAGAKTTIDCDANVTYHTSKNRWTSFLEARDSSIMTKLFTGEATFENDKAQLKAELLSQIVPFLKETPLSSWSPIFDGFKVAHCDLLIDNVRSPLTSLKGSLNVATDVLDLNVLLTFDHSTLFVSPSVGKKELLKWTLTPDLVALLQKKGFLGETFPISGSPSIRVTTCSLKSQIDSKTYIPTTLDGELALTIDPLRMAIQGKSCSLSAIHAALQIENAKKALLTLQSEPPSQKENASSLSGQCTLLYSAPLHALSLDTMKINGALSLHDIPAALVSAVLPKAEVLKEFLGPSFTISTQFTSDKLKSGELQFHLNSPHLACNLNSSIIQNGVLTLTSPLTARLQIDKKGSSALFKRLSNYICSELKEDHEITLTIDPKGTLIPLSAFSLQALSIPSIRLDLGKVSVKSSGLLKTLIHILHPKTSTSTIDLWWTKAYASFRKGEFKLNRVDCLAGNLLHLFVWGSMDLSNNKINMRVGIPQDTFTRLKLYLSLPKPVTLTITGKIDSPTIDTMRLTARLAGAGAASVGTGSLQGPLALLGGALQVASTVGDENIEIPEPIESPFPWE